MTIRWRTAAVLLIALAGVLPAHAQSLPVRPLPAQPAAKSGEAPDTETAPAPTAAPTAVQPPQRALTPGTEPTAPPRPVPGAASGSSAPPTADRGTPASLAPPAGGRAGPTAPAPAGALPSTPATPALQSPGRPGAVAGSAAPALAPLAPPPAAGAQAAPDAPPIEFGQLLVGFPSAEAAQAGFAEVQARYGVAVTEAAAFANLGLVVGVVQLDSNEAAARLRQQLAKAHPDWIVDFNAQLAPLAGPRLYALTQIGGASGAPPAPGARMGLLDSDVDAIPALAQARIAVRRFVEGTGADANAHGSAIAALLVGQDAASGFQGVAPGTELVVGAIVRRDGKREDSTVTLLLAGLDWLLAQDVRVINVSLGGPPNALMAAAIGAVTRRGVVIVAAAGNGGPGAPPAYPAAYPGVIAVTANDAAGNVFERANRGEYVLLSAPGVDVWVPDRAGGRYVSGTSFAAAAVTGAVSLLLRATPDATPEQVGRRLCATARNLGDPGRDPVYGCGLLQVQAAAAPR